MFSYVPIANIALQHIGESNRIVAPDENSKPARAIKAAWDLTFLFVLAEAHWSFALFSRDLTARTANPDFPLRDGFFAFPLPAELVTLVEILEPCSLEEPDAYSIERGPNGTELICEEAGPVRIRFVGNTAAVQDPSSWSPAFVEAFSFRLAWQISDELAADKARKDRAYAASNAALKLAKRANARTKASQTNATTPWSAARGRGRGRAPNT